MPDTPLGISTDVAQNRGDSSAIGIHLHRRPRLVVLAACILSFDSNEMTVSRADAVPHAGPCMIASPGSDDVERAVTAKTKLRQRAP
jgi:hypothetical protein